MMIINSYNLSRTILAIGTLLTLMFNSNYTLFGNIIFSDLNLNENNTLKINLFYLLQDNLILCKILCIGVLLSVIIGVYPRITGLFHAYVTWSFFIATDVLDGGDHIASNLTLLLLPLCFMDSSKNHWKEYGIKNKFSSFFYKIIIIQVFFIYLHAFIGKIAVEEWANGTALYYWVTHNHFGINDLFVGIANKLLSNNIVILVITWGVLSVQFLLAANILLRQDDNRRFYFLLFGIIFHFMILLVHGLFSFFFVMSSCLILYLIPFGKIYNIEFLKKELLNFKFVIK